MPRYAGQRDFQLGDYWLSQRSGSPAWHRTWFDPETRQTRRTSLGTTDFDEAKQRLTDWFILEQTRPQKEATDLLLAEVFPRFYEQHGKTLVSASDVNRSLRDWLTFHGEATVAEATTQEAQRNFRDWLSKERGLSVATVRRVLIVGKSALNWAWKRGEIVQVPYIALVTPPAPEPKGRPLEIEEVVRLFKSSRESHVTVLMAFMLGTAARTGAILDLKLSQIDVDKRLIFLNPPGRRQTNKYRPTVRLPSQLVAFVEKRQESGKDDPLVTYHGAAVKSVKTNWRKLVVEAGLEGNVQTYSFRHTMARWMRMQGVPAWEVAAQLGHKAPEYSTTEIYAPFDPAYLSNAVGAIDRLLELISEQLDGELLGTIINRDL